MIHLTVAFFLPGQQILHHSSRTKFLCSRIDKKWYMQTIFGFAVPFRILSSQKKIFNFRLHGSIFSRLGEYWKFLNFLFHKLSTNMCSESNLWEKLSKLKPKVFGSQTNCLSLSLERISSIFYIRNILNFSLWDWINGGTHILPQPEKTSDDIWNIGIKNGKDLYGKKESLRIVQFILLRNNLIKIFFPYPGKIKFLFLLTI